MPRVLIVVVASCALVQLLSATWMVRDYTTPNVSREIAEQLVATGEYANGDARAYQLPGEPLLIAAGLHLPSALRPYLHVPVVMLFVGSITATALAVWGTRVAGVAGGLATLDPFVVAHGPVWDDAMLAASLEWLVIALLVHALPVRNIGPAIRSRSGAARLVAGLAAGGAAITRLHSQWLLAGLAVITLSRRRFAAARGTAAAIAIGLVLAVGLWGWRNANTVGAFISGSTHDGKTFFESTYSTARGAILENGAAQNFEAGKIPPQALTPIGGEVAMNRYFMNEAWRYIVAHPFDVMVTAVFKTMVSLSGVDFARPLTSPRNLVGVASNLALLFTAVAGIAAWRRHPGSATDRGRLVATAAVTTALTTFALLAAGPVGLRYRISLAGFFYLAAALALHIRFRPTTEALSARM